MKKVLAILFVATLTSCGGSVDSTSNENVTDSVVTVLVSPITLTSVSEADSTASDSTSVE